MWGGACGGVVVKALATNRQVAGSIPDDVIEIFQWHNPSGRTMALGSTQTLKEMSTRCISWGKGGRYVRLTTLQPSFAVVMKSGNLNFLEHSGPLQGCMGTALPLPLYIYIYVSNKTEYIYIYIRCILVCNIQDYQKVWFYNKERLPPCSFWHLEIETNIK
jgi:hypothetical protein